MKKGFTYMYFVAFIAIAAITQWALIKYIPNLVHAIAVHRVKLRNEWINNNKTDAGMRSVVMPNPDFIYSALFYDVKKHDIEISGTLPDSTYASVTFYDDRCQPYYVCNNLEIHRTGSFEFMLSKSVLKGGSDLLKVGDNDAMLKAKTNTGVIICRYLLKGDNAFSKMKALQLQLACTVK